MPGVTPGALTIVSGGVIGSALIRGSLNSFYSMSAASFVTAIEASYETASMISSSLSSSFSSIASSASSLGGPAIVAAAGASKASIAGLTAAIGGGSLVGGAALTSPLIALGAELHKNPYLLDTILK